MEDDLTLEEVSINSLDLTRWIGSYTLRIEEVQVFTDMFNSLAATISSPSWFIISGGSHEDMNIAQIIEMGLNPLQVCFLF